MCFLVFATNMTMYNENTQQNTPRKIVWDSLFSPLSMDVWRAFKGLTLVVCTLKQTETSHPTSKFSKISTNPQTVGQNPPVFFVCLNHSPTFFRGYLSQLVAWKCLESWTLCPHHFFFRRCIKVTQFNKIKSWLRSLPQCCVFFLRDLFWQVAF